MRYATTALAFALVAGVARGFAPISGPRRPTRLSPIAAASEFGTTWTVAALKDACRAKRLKVGGRKAELIARLTEWEAAQKPPPPVVYVDPGPPPDEVYSANAAPKEAPADAEQLSKLLDAARAVMEEKAAAAAQEEAAAMDAAADSVEDAPADAAELSKLLDAARAVLEEKEAARDAAAEAAAAAKALEPKYILFTEEADEPAAAAGDDADDADDGAAAAPELALEDSPEVWARLAAAVPALSGDQLEALKRCAALVLQWNERINLVSRSDQTRLVARHLAPSLAPLNACDLAKGGAKVLDVGTGGGFPGLPLAIAAPGSHFTLTDCRSKKVFALREIVRELGLTNVDVVHAYAQDLPRTRKFDFVVGRAVCALPKFCKICEGRFEEDPAADVDLTREDGSKEPTPLERWGCDRGVLYIKGGDFDAELASLGLGDGASRTELEDLLGGDGALGNGKALVYLDASALRAAELPAIDELSGPDKRRRRERTGTRGFNLDVAKLPSGGQARDFGKVVAAVPLTKRVGKAVWEPRKPRDSDDNRGGGRRREDDRRGPERGDGLRRSQGGKSWRGSGQDRGGQAPNADASGRGSSWKVRGGGGRGGDDDRDEWRGGGGGGGGRDRRDDRGGGRDDRGGGRSNDRW